MTAPTTEHWELDHRPTRLRTLTVVAAGVVMALHLAWALTLRSRDTGVTLGVADQLAFVALGIIFSGAVLLLLRVRVRAGAAGVEITGPLRRRVWPWDLVVGFTYPASSPWPRLELPAYEHVAIAAVQSWDGDRAVEAMRRLREIAGRYHPSAADPASVADR